MSFAKLAPLATIVVFSAVAGMVLFAQNRPHDPAPPAVTLPAHQGISPPSPPTTPQGVRASVRPVRKLVPPGAWLVADFAGDLTGELPFADQPGICASVPAPSRVAMALLPPSGGAALELLIAARQVEDVFWGCARDRIVRAGGTALAQNDRYEVLKSPTGVVARGPSSSMVFLSGEAHLESALAVLSELEEGAATTGPHADLYQRMYADGRSAEASALDVTLALPGDWLSSVGQDKEKTPLRFIRSAYASSLADGSATGGIDCDEAGCAEVLAFLLRAKSDLTKDLPPDVGAAIVDSLKTHHVKGSGRIEVSWSPSKIPLTALLTRFLGAGSAVP